MLKNNKQQSHSDHHLRALNQIKIYVIFIKNVSLLRKEKGPWRNWIKEVWSSIISKHLSKSREMGSAIDLIRIVCTKWQMIMMMVAFKYSERHVSQHHF